MDYLSYKTISVKQSEIQVSWHLVDAQSIPLGRLASLIANIIRGKNKPCFTPNVNCGDKVVVINSDKLILSGNKINDKQYVSYTGYPGGQKFAIASKLREKDSRKMIVHAVKGMLPKNKLSDQILKNLYVYKSDTHNQVAQKPKLIEVKY